MIYSLYFKKCLRVILNQRIILLTYMINTDFKENGEYQLTLTRFKLHFNYS